MNFLRWLFEHGNRWTVRATVYINWTIAVAALGILTAIVSIAVSFKIGGDVGQLTIRVGGGVAIALLGVAFLMVKIAVTGIVMLVPKLREEHGDKLNKTAAGLFLWTSVYVFLCMMVPIWESVSQFALMTACVFMGMLIVHRGWFQGRIFKYLVAGAVMVAGLTATVTLLSPTIANKVDVIGREVRDLAIVEMGRGQDEIMVRRLRHALVNCKVDRCRDESRIEAEYRRAMARLGRIEDAVISKDDAPRSIQITKVPARRDGLAEADALLKNLGF